MTESKLALPHLIIGLGSEMINVLNNRIEAQKIPLQKADQLRQGLVRYLYSEKFIDEMLTPQKIYPLNSAQDIFKKLLMLSVLKTDHSG